VAAWADVAGDRAGGGEEALGVARVLEAPHPPFPLPRGLVRVLGPVVQALVSAVLDARQHLPQRRPVAGELVLSDKVGLVGLPGHEGVPKVGGAAVQAMAEVPVTARQVAKRSVLVSR